MRRRLRGSGPESATAITSIGRVPILLAAALLASATGGELAAESVKTVNGITYEGKLLRYDEGGVQLQLPTGKILEFKPEEVDSVDAKLSPHHEAAKRALADGRYEEAVREYKLAEGTEDRPWARAQILSGRVRALTASGRLNDAGLAFRELARQRTEPEIMQLAPLLWMADEKPPAEARRAARTWLDDTDPMTRLLAGSWLLNSDERERAAAALEELQTAPEQRISWMARAQMWRLRTGSASADEIDRFRELIAKMPPSIRGGPQYLLALAYEKADMPAEAALAFLWVPFVYKGNADLLADATQRAAAACERAGFADEAQTLYREVASKYPGTAWAEAARKKLEQAN